MASFKPDPRSQYHNTKTEGRTLRIIFIAWQEDSAEAKEWKVKSEQWNSAKPDKFQIVYYNPRENANVYLVNANTDPKAVIYIRGHGSPGANSLKANVDDEQRSLAVTDVCQRLIDMGLKPVFSGAIKFHSCYSATIFTDEEFQKSRAAAEKTLRAARERKDYLTQPTGLAKDISDAKTILQNTKDKLTEEQNKWFWSRDNERVGRLTTKVQRREGRVSDLEKQQSQAAGADGYIRERELRIPTGNSIASQGAAYMRLNGFDKCSFFGYLGPMESLYTMDTSSPDQKEMYKFVSLEGLKDAPDEVVEHLKTGADVNKVRASVARVKIL